MSVYRKTVILRVSLIVELWNKGAGSGLEFVRH